MLEVFPRSIEGYGWASSNSSDDYETNEIKKQLIRYKNHIDELQYQIEVLKLENFKLKEELNIFRDDILDDYEKTVDNHR